MAQLAQVENSIKLGKYSFFNAIREPANLETKDNFKW